jgi:hypothetical protein
MDRVERNVVIPGDLLKCGLFLCAAGGLVAVRCRKIQVDPTISVGTTYYIPGLCLVFHRKIDSIMTV